MTQLLKPVFQGVILLICVIPAAVAQEAADDPEIFGWIEPVYLPLADFQLEAKLDTGADNSSLGAVNIRRVRVGENHYVRYSVRHPQTGELISLRSPYIRSTSIRNHSGTRQRRRVVEMALCLGEHQRTVEVNLVDRDEFDYPLLLGRSALEDIAIIDPSLTRLSEPDCEQDDK